MPEKKLSLLEGTDYTKIILTDATDIGKILTPKGLEKICATLAPYTSWNSNLIALKKENPSFQYGGKANINSFSFQGVNFITDDAYNQYHYNRTQLIEILKVLLPGKSSSDVIQIFNKTDQKGLARDFFAYKGVTYYGCRKPTFTNEHLIKRATPINFGAAEQNESTKAGKARLQKWRDGKWEVGHRDPRKPLTPENSVMQPQEINRTAKGNRIFEADGITSNPTPNYLVNNFTNIYPDKEDQIFIATELQKILPGLLQSK